MEYIARAFIVGYWWGVASGLVLAASIYLEFRIWQWVWKRIRAFVGRSSP